MKQPLKVGDRVRVYCVNLAEQAARFKGTVISIAADTAMVRGDEYPTLKLSVVHVKQCRRLVKKEPRREFYIYCGQAYEIHNERSMLEDVCEQGKWDKAIRVVERRPKRGKKI